MKKGDLVWAGVLLALAGLLSTEVGRQHYSRLATAYPYLGGFLKFMVLATMGELLTLRLRAGRWQRTPGLLPKALVWGVLGVLITFMFGFYSAGIAALQGAGKLPGDDSALVRALLISTTMNLTFGLAFMMAHRLTDTVIEQRLARGRFSDFGETMAQVQWPAFLTFVVKSLIFFWIPAHTAVFLLPPAYRVLAAALLSIVLGVLLTMAGRRKAAADPAP